MRQILFFAAGDDLVPVIEAVERRTSLQYLPTGSLARPEPEVLSTGNGIPNLGFASSGAASSCSTYLVCKTEAPVRVRHVAQTDGSSRYLVDQLANPDTVTFTPAGAWTNEILLYGRVATASETAPSQELMKLFRNAIRSRFTKVRAFYVGPCALTWLRAGKRLTISDRSSGDVDLKATH